MFACLSPLDSQPWKMDPAEPLPGIHLRARTSTRAALARCRYDAPTNDRNIPTALSPPPPHSPQHPQTNSAGGTKSAPADSTATSSVVIVARNMLPALSPIRPVGLGIPHVPLPHTQLSPTLTAAATPHAGSESTTQAQAQPSQHPGQGNVWRGSPTRTDGGVGHSGGHADRTGLLYCAHTTAVRVERRSWSNSYACARADSAGR